MKATTALLALMLMGAVAVVATPAASALECLPVVRDDPQCAVRNAERTIGSIERALYCIVYDACP